MNGIGDTCDFDSVVIALRAEVSKDGQIWERWEPSTALDREEPRNENELRAILRTYARTAASALSTIPHDTNWVRAVAECTLTGRAVGMDVRGFDWPTRTYIQAEARSWIICDNPRDCSQWRVLRLTKRLEGWGKVERPAKHAKARPHWYSSRGVMVGGIAAVMLTMGGVTMAHYAAQNRPPVTAGPVTPSHSPTPSPTRTEVVKVVEVKIPDGGTVTVPVGGSEEETRKAITRVVNKTLEHRRKEKRATASPNPSDSAGRDSDKPNPKPDSEKSPHATPDPEETPDAAPENLMPVNAILDAVLPKPVTDPGTRVLGAPTPELRLFSQQLAAMGEVTGQMTVQQDRTTALAATVDIKGAAKPVTVAAAVTTKPFSPTSTVEVATAKTEDEKPAKSQEEAPRTETDETVTRVGVTAVMDAVDADDNDPEVSPQTKGK
ncbi:hypothetical protein [Streptomyces sp. NPDC094144]|uniref:hypothetical protein n=1 Tax=Streptomyces sp. NPDC094144 TaxID=3366056 RepID=UPI003830A3C2